MWYLPSVVPVVASATIWRWGLNPEFGPINYPLKVLGIPAPRWLTDPDWIIPSIVFIGLWGSGQHGADLPGRVERGAAYLLRSG